MTLLALTISAESFIQIILAVFTGIVGFFLIRLVAQLDKNTKILSEVIERLIVLETEKTGKSTVCTHIHTGIQAQFADIDFAIDQHQKIITKHGEEIAVLKSKVK